MHGLHVIARDVGDHPEAYTRFVSIATHTRLDRVHADWRTAFSFVTDHRAGALHSAIEPFARHGIDLVQLVSRPIPQSPWTYRFDAVLAGHPLEDATRAALGELRAQVRQTAGLRVVPCRRLARERQRVDPRRSSRARTRRSLRSGGA